MFYNYNYYRNSTSKNFYGRRLHSRHSKFYLKSIEKSNKKIKNDNCDIQREGVWHEKVSHIQQKKKKSTIINLKNLIKIQSEKENIDLKIKNESSLTIVEESKELSDPQVKGYLIIPKELKEKSINPVISSPVKRKPDFSSTL